MSIFQQSETSVKSSQIVDVHGVALELDADGRAIRLADMADVDSGDHFGHVVVVRSRPHDGRRTYFVARTDGTYVDEFEDRDAAYTTAQRLDVEPEPYEPTEADWREYAEWSAALDAAWLDDQMDAEAALDEPDPDTMPDWDLFHDPDPSEFPSVLGIGYPAQED